MRQGMGRDEERPSMEHARTKGRGPAPPRRPHPHLPHGARSGGAPAGPEPESRETGAASAGVPTEAQVRDAWLRAEACCECVKEAHGHPGRCDQFLIWAERGGTGKGAWEARRLQDPRRPPCIILCAACYAKASGQLPQGV